MKKILFIIAASLSLSTFAAEKTELPIIAHWSFDNDSGTILQDSGPNKLNAKLKSKDKKAQVETAEGMKGQALKLSAKPLIRYVVQDKKKILDLKPPFTIAMWIKRTGKMPKSMCLLNKMADSGKAGGWDLRYDWAMLDLRFSHGQKRQIVMSPKHQIKNDKWYHVAATNDGKKIQLFINCEKVKEQIFDNATPAPNKRVVVIGNYTGRADAYNFIGLLDEVYIVGKVLSSEELFNLTAPKK
jgi:Concanavalin A-like lectin/glucanases superfamily